MLCVWLKGVGGSEQMQLQWYYMVVEGFTVEIDLIVVTLAV